MRGGQLACQRVARPIEVSPNGLTLTETKIAQREENGPRTIYRDPELLQMWDFHYISRLEGGKILII